MAIMNTNYGPWLGDLFRRTGKKKKDLADAVFGGNAAAVSKILANRRRITAAERDAILAFFEDGNTRKPLSTDLVPVIGVAAAGVWREAEAVPVAGAKVIPVLSIRGSQSAYALLVEGNSVNLAVPSGAYAICVPYWERRSEIRDGDLVHVERRRAGTVEATIKRVRRAGKRIELMPESDDPAFQATIPLNESGDTDAVEIVGLVVGTYTERESF